MKILHVTNIAQNAYINASILNARGHDCDVAAYDLYHFACSAEWYHLANSDISPSQLGNDYFPDFYTLGQGIPRIAGWMAHGPQVNVLTYLKLRRRRDPLAATAQAVLAYLRFKATVLRTTQPNTVVWPESEFNASLAAYDLPTWLKSRIVSGRIYDRIWLVMRLGLLRFQERTGVAELMPPAPFGLLDDTAKYDKHFAEFLHAIRQNGLSQAIGLEMSPPSFQAPHVMKFGFTEEEVRPYLIYAELWAELAALYDMCIFYGDSSIFAFLAGIPEYSALEHGTIRAIPFEPTTYGRLVRQGFLGAQRVFITNTDYVTASPRLEFHEEQRVYLPHPFDEAPAFRFRAEHRRHKPDSDISFFCPARQDWVSNDPKMAKGCDRYFHAARLLIDGGARNFRLHCIDWGVDREASYALVAELGLTDHVSWLPPMPKSRLWQEMLDSHAVIDQFVISVISGIAFEALALGCRLITKDDGIANRSFFGEAPPILAASEAGEVARRMREVMEDPDDTAGRGEKGPAWIRHFHSADRIVRLQIDAFSGLRSVEAVRRLG